MSQDKFKIIIHVLVAMFIGAGYLQAQEYQTIRLPVVINYDGTANAKYVVCDMSYVFKGIPYNIPCSEFAARAESPAEKTVCRIIEAIQTKNEQDASLLCFSNTNARPSQQDKKRISSFLSVLTPAFHNNALRLYFQVRYDRHTLFIFGLSDTRQFFGLTVSGNADGSLFWNTSEASPLTGGIITSVMGTDAALQEAFAKKDYQYQIPLTDPNCPDKIYLGFNGRDYQDMEYLSLADDLDKSAAMMLQLCIAAQTGHLKEISSCFTPKSQEWLISLFELSSIKKLDNLKRSLNSKPRILFVIDADPLYVVFHKRSSGHDLPCLYIQEILREDQKLKYTDFHFNNLLTQILVSDVFLKGLGTHISDIAGLIGAQEMR